MRALFLYQLPQELQFEDFRSMLKFQLYLELIAADASLLRNDLYMPKQLAALEQIEKRAPELIERPLDVRWRSISKEELCRDLSVKETWLWETDDAHWALLQKNFSELAQEKAGTTQQRLAALGKLNEKQRHRVDQFARRQMIEGQSERIQLALNAAPVKTSAIGLKTKGGVLPFPGIKESAELVALLEGASLSTEDSNVASASLNYYSPDGENFYSIQVLKREGFKKVLTFAEASKDGTLDALLDKRLEESYPEIRRKNSSCFQQTNGQWKPFKEVKDQIGKYLFADLLKSIESNYRIHYGLLPGYEGELPLNFYSNARMLPYMKEAQKNLQSDGIESNWVKLESEPDHLASQWLLTKVEQTIERCSEVSFSKEEMFTMGIEEWVPSEDR